jgi:hypothetical protein
VEPIKLSGAREKVAKKTYIRANRYPSPGFDRALADCKADKSWGVVETNIPGHVIMLDAPEWLTRAAAGDAGDRVPQRLGADGHGDSLGSLLSVWECGPERSVIYRIVE